MPIFEVAADAEERRSVMQLSSQEQRSNLRSTLHDRVHTLLPPRLRLATPKTRAALAIGQSSSLTSLILRTQPAHLDRSNSTLGLTLQSLVSVLVTTDDQHVLSQLSVHVSSAFAHVASHFSEDLKLLPPILGALLIAASKSPAKKWPFSFSIFSSSSPGAVSGDSLRHPLVIILDALLKHWPIQPRTWTPAHYANITDTVSIAVGLCQHISLLDVLSYSTPTSPDSPSLPRLAVCAGVCNAVGKNTRYNNGSEYLHLKRALASLCGQASFLLQPLCARIPTPFLTEGHLPAISMLFCVACAGPLVFEVEENENSSFPAPLLNCLRESFDTLISHSFTRFGKGKEQSPSSHFTQQTAHTDSFPLSDAPESWKVSADDVLQKQMTTALEMEKTVKGKLTPTTFPKKLELWSLDQPLQMTISRMAMVYARLVQRTNATQTCLSVMQAVMTNELTTPLKSLFILTFLRCCSAYMDAHGNACLVDSASYLQHFHHQRDSNVDGSSGKSDPPIHSRSTLFRVSLTPLIRSIATQRSAVNELVTAACAIFDIDSVHRHPGVQYIDVNSLEHPRINAVSVGSLPLSRGLIITQYIAQALMIQNQPETLTRISGCDLNDTDDGDIWCRLVCKLLALSSAVPIGYLRLVLNLPVVLISAHDGWSGIRRARDYSIINSLRAVTERYVSVNTRIHEKLPRSTASELSEVRKIVRCMVSVIDVIAKSVHDRLLLTSCLSSLVKICSSMSSTSHSTGTTCSNDAEPSANTKTIESNSLDESENREIPIYHNITACLMYFMQLCDRQFVDIPMHCIKQLVGDSPSRRLFIKPVVGRAILQMELGRKDLCLKWFIDNFSNLPDSRVLRSMDSVFPRAKL